MTCKQCIHHTICPLYLKDEDAERCKIFTDKTNFVEVVRCKDCKWWTKQTDSSQGRCALSGHYPTGYWYCANGERK